MDEYIDILQALDIISGATKEYIDNLYTIVSDEKIDEMLDNIFGSE